MWAQRRTYRVCRTSTQKTPNPCTCLPTQVFDKLCCNENGPLLEGTLRHRQDGMGAKQVATVLSVWLSNTKRRLQRRGARGARWCRAALVDHAALRLVCAASMIAGIFADTPCCTVATVRRRLQASGIERSRREPKGVHVYGQKRRHGSVHEQERLAGELHV